MKYKDRIDLCACDPQFKGKLRKFPDETVNAQYQQRLGADFSPVCFSRASLCLLHRTSLTNLINTRRHILWSSSLGR